MNAYDIGDVVRLRASFTNSGGAAVDPSSLTLQYQIVKPVAGPLVALVYGVNSIVRAGVGEFYHDLDVTSAGEWRYRYNGTGLNAAAAEGVFNTVLRWVGP